MDIRALLRAIHDVIDICYDFSSGTRNTPATGDVDIDRTLDLLYVLRDVLERLFKIVTTRPAGVGSTMTQLEASMDMIHGLLVECMDEMSDLEMVLKHRNRRNRIKGSDHPSSSNWDMVLSNLMTSANALRVIVDQEQT